MIKKPLAGIIDISINNILSIKRALEYVGFDVVIINEYRNIEEFDLIVLPGVGAFHEAMKKLKNTKLIKSIEQALEKNKNFLAICLGMQLLFEESEEFGLTRGISFFEGKVESFKKYNVEKKTFIGWNKVNFQTKNKLIKNPSIENDLSNSAFYFVHSYFAKCKNKDIEVGISLNGKLNFPSIIKKNKVVAFQFHPEKSGKSGLLLLKNILITS
jgi:glutamine amidotransferase